jgi:hypothetical protein
MRKLVSGLTAVVLAVSVLAAGLVMAPPAVARVHVFVGVGPWWGWPGPYYYPPPPVVYVPPYYAPTPPPPAPLAVQPQSWYYCDNPRGYYPYVPSCRSGWRPVPARPR